MTVTQTYFNIVKRNGVMNNSECIIGEHSLLVHLEGSEDYCGSE